VPDPTKNLAFLGDFFLDLDPKSGTIETYRFPAAGICP
jgi:hypothetical protein